MAELGKYRLTNRSLYLIPIKSGVDRPSPVAMVPVMPAVIPVVPMMMPAMMTPVHFGGHLARGKLLIILDSGGCTGIDERHCVGVLGRHGQNQQRAGCGEA